MLQKFRTTCAYCGVGCGVIAHAENGHIVGVEGDPEHPANFGRLCSKGATLHLSAQADGRALYPELRRERSRARERTGWDEALAFAADRFARVIKEHGPDSVAFYVSGQLLTEDYYVFNKLAKGLIGTNNIDTNSRLCMSSAVSGYKRTLGADAPPACYEDIDHTQCLFIAGSNTAFAHPILMRRIEDARAANPEMKLVVVDPRRTDTAASADLHLAILPGSDVALFNGMLQIMLWEGLCDLDYVRDHTEDFVALKAAVAEYTPKAVAQLCGVRAEEVVQAARWFGGSKATLSLYCQGLNQSIQGTDKNAALINLHLASGQIGKRGAGPFSLTGQPNAMGGREVGGMATLLPGHRELSDPAHREEIARFWGVESLSATPGKTAVDLFEAVRRGEIKAVWIACTNPVQSMPEQARVAEALAGAQFVVVQEAVRNTETTAFADLLLPANAWGEKEGTVTNSERRISRVRAAVAGPGEARNDWEIVVDFAHRLEHILGRDASGLFAFGTPEQVFNEHRETTRGRDLDISGLSYDILETQGPQQWPFPDGAKVGKARLYENGIFPTASGRAKFASVAHCGLAEPTDARYPLALLTGRLRDQWHGMSRTGTVARLFAHEEELLLSMNRADLRTRGLVEGDIVSVKSRRGELRLRVRADDTLRPAQVWLPMHWGGRFMRGGGVNALTLPACDPFSKQPELKHTAVQVKKLDLRWQLVAMRSGNVSRYLDAAQPLLQKFDYATCGLYGHDHPLMVFRVACAAPPDAALVALLDEALNLDDESAQDKVVAMDYRDTRRGIAKRVLLCDGKIIGVRLTGETAARDWLKEMMAAGASAESVRPWMLAPLTAPPVGQRARGKVVCICLNVAEPAIRECLAAGLSLTEVQAKLKCGTSCGSCVPELRCIAATNLAAA